MSLANMFAGYLARVRPRLTISPLGLALFAYMARFFVLSPAI